jgi:hypothetical protein
MVTLTSPPEFTLKESAITSEASKYLEGLEVTVKLNDIPDTFNDKLDFKCKNFTDLKRLNEEMLKVALKYELFGENDKSTPYLRKFLENFEHIQVGLGELETAMIDAKSSVGEIKKKVDDLNNSVKQFAKYKSLTWKGQRKVDANIQ